ncbi:MAG: hypothetical protein WCJ09_07605 [Planctomycetota bacterium]
MITKILKLCGWLFYALIAAIVVFAFALADASRLYSGVPGFYRTVVVTVVWLGASVVACFLLGKGGFKLSCRYTKDGRRPRRSYRCYQSAPVE